MQSISLQKAILCLDCENIYQKNGACPNCGSKAGWPISKWINTISIVSARYRINDTKETKNAG